MTDFISQKYSLKQQPEVLKSGGEQAYFERINKILHPLDKNGKPNERQRERNIELLRNRFHDKYVIKAKDIPESYWKHQEEMFRERGEMDDYLRAPEQVKQETKHRLAETVVEDQRKSLDVWIDYLVSGEAAYPDWFKYYVIREVLSTGSYNRDTNQYSGRKSGTTAPYPELNSQALAKVLDRINAGNQQEKERTKGYKFPILYAEELRKLVPLDEKQLAETRGVWKTYPKGSDETLLTKTMAGFNTNLCIAGDATAKSYLSSGDLTVYYSMDENGTPRIPRAALHVVQGNLQEVRGIGTNQNTDPYIADVLAKKLKEYPNGEEYAKQSADMKRVTSIARKMDKNIPLDKDELVFLYEIDAPIQGFGRGKDPRIDELRKQRDLKVDAPIVLACEPKQIATSEKEITSDTKAYIGPLFPGIFKLNLENIFTRFPEGKIRNIELEIGGKTRDEYVSAIEKKGMKNHEYALDMLKSKDFVTSKKREDINLVRLTVGDLGFPSGATNKEIIDRAATFGLELCPPEVGPAYRLQLTDQPMDDWVIVAMKAIAGRDAYPRFFFVGRHDYGTWLRSADGHPDYGWDAVNSFLFRSRK